ncbi:MAG: metal-dependent transcriptional regulator, partial [Planctomycetes bacterium]|nr:metal-dependent transcriptional regulator [Planctomycetota bacterium]
MPEQAKPSAAMENYLEAILKLTQEGGAAHVRDIAGAVGVTLPTVTGTLRNLARRNLVRYRPYEAVRLTPKGRDVARKINRRHRLLYAFFRDVLGVGPETADADACRVEHGLSVETVDGLAGFMDSFG